MSGGEPVDRLRQAAADSARETPCIRAGAHAAHAYPIVEADDALTYWCPGVPGAPERRTAIDDPARQAQIDALVDGAVTALRFVSPVGADLTAFTETFRLLLNAPGAPLGSL